MKKQKQFMLDTSVILDTLSHLPALYQNGKNKLFISDIVLKELNGHKEDKFSEKGYLAREFIRSLDRGDFKNVTSEIKRGEKDIILKFSITLEKYSKDIEIYVVNRESYHPANNTNDLKIVEIASQYNLDLITNDVALKLISISKGVSAESMKKDSVDSPEKIDFVKTIDYQKNDLKLAELKAIEDTKDWTQIELQEWDEVDNKRCSTGLKKLAIKKENNLKYISDEDFSLNRIKPINLEQKFYAKMLSMNFSIMVVAGSTGSGKTLLALTEGIKRVKDQSDPIDGIIYMRNTVTANDQQAELGYRKGDQATKLGYFAYPLFGAINFILENSFKNSSESLTEKIETKKCSITKEEHTQRFMSEFNIEIMDIAHARGVTISNKFVIFDELQNASLSTLQLIGTRIGKGSRLVLMGDYRQVDHPYLTKNRNALVTMLQKAENSDDIAAIQLRKTIRSDIANWFQENL